MSKSIMAGDARDLDVLEALGELDLPRTEFWKTLGLAGGDDIEFRTLHGNRDALLFEGDRFEGFANLHLLAIFEDDEGKEDKIPRILAVRYEGAFEGGKPVFKRISFRNKKDPAKLHL